jgi:hypothetical protein
VKVKNVQTNQNKEDNKMELIYHEGADGMLYPNLTIQGMEEAKPLGKYGKLRRKYLMENKSNQFQAMLLMGKWWSHLWEVDEKGQEMEDRITAQMAERQGVTEQMKAENQLLWVQKMNNIMQAAQEVVLNDLIYQ